MKMNNSVKDNFDFLLEMYKTKQEFYSPWIQRKEIASWAGVLLYVGIYSFLFKILLEKYDKTINTVDLITIILPIFVLIIYLSFIIFSLIHSHFASIYYHTAYMAAFRNVLFKFKSKGHSEIIDFEIDPELDIPGFLVDEFKVRIKKLKPYQNECHPLKIVLHFWSFEWFKKKENRKKPPFGNLAKQEASIYSLIFIFNLILLFPLVRIIYPYIFC
jgi:hypothetical protein